MSIDDLREDQFLLRQIERLLAPSYVDANTILTKALRNNSFAYLGFLESGSLCSFFFVGEHYPALENTKLFYLGLSACEESKKGRGLTYQLYKHFLTETEGMHERAFHWATTANPLVYFLMRRLFKRIAPGSKQFADLNDVALEIRNQIEPLRFSCQSPFILKKFSPSVRYSQIEIGRLESAYRRRNSVADFLAIDESEGDRLLVVATTWSTSNEG